MAQKTKKMLLKMMNEWLWIVQLFPKVWILEISRKAFRISGSVSGSHLKAVFGYPYPFANSLSCRISNRQTGYWSSLQHGRRFVLMCRIHGPQTRPYAICKAWAATPNTGAEAVKLDPVSSWKGNSGGSGGWEPVLGIKMQSLVGLSAHSAFHWWSAQCAAHMLLL